MEDIYLLGDNVLYYRGSTHSQIIFRQVREDTHKKSFFFSGRTTKGVGRLTQPPDH